MKYQLNCFYCNQNHKRMIAWVFKYINDLNNNKPENSIWRHDKYAHSGHLFEHIGYHEYYFKRNSENLYSVYTKNDKVCVYDCTFSYSSNTLDAILTDKKTMGIVVSVLFEKGKKMTVNINNKDDLHLVDLVVVMVYAYVYN